ncbi:trimethylamine methyltransferase family protein [Hoeflea sp. TYP-13]|uniref:trimethylamine methyltransferase family protein n=1 Tax=Hoeflea sp. TYP-13 TaxID=3230023 RepID=UPI0034C68401
MTTDLNTPARRRGRRRQAQSADKSHADAGYYKHIKNTLPRVEVLSQDEVEAIHRTSLRVLQELGIRVLNDEARRILSDAGCEIRDEMMVHFPSELVTELVSKAPHSMVWNGGDGIALDIDQDALLFGPGAGCPNVTDTERGRRPGTLEDYVDFTKLQQHFDIIPFLAPSIEPQDVPIHERHLLAGKVQLETSNKVPWVYARGSGQVFDSFEMIRLARGLSEEAFRERIWTYTVINTNSPRQIDVPMAQGIIDFARWGQPSIITPFCLSGAMAPITEAGSLTLSHAEAMAGTVLAQAVNPGAPVIYGAFSSNVNMKSGAPVFGTPEHIRTNFGAGQLARRLGIPWRSATGTAGNAPDVQSAAETQLGIWGAVLGGANLIIHSTGWLEGGLTISYEKFIMDLEVCQTIAQAMKPVEATEDAIGFEAIAEVQPGGHFFEAQQTMARYSDQFYEPLIRDWTNFGQWEEAGGLQTVEQAHTMWKQIIRDFEPPALPQDRLDAITDFVERRKREGGAPPVD